MPPPPDGRDPRVPATASRSLRALRPDSQCPSSPARHGTLCRTPATPPPLPSITRAVFAGALPARAVPPGLPASEKLDKDHFHRASCTIPAGQRQLPLAPRPAPLCPPAPGTASGLARRLSTSRMLVSSPDPCAPLQALHWQRRLPAQVVPLAGVSLPLASQDLPRPFLRAPLSLSLSLPPPSHPSPPCPSSILSPPPRPAFLRRSPATANGDGGAARSRTRRRLQPLLSLPRPSPSSVPHAPRLPRQPPLGAAPLGGSLGGTASLRDPRLCCRTPPASPTRTLPQGDFPKESFLTACSPGMPSVAAAVPAPASAQAPTPARFRSGRTV